MSASLTFEKEPPSAKRFFAVSIVSGVTGLIIGLGASFFLTAGATARVAAAEASLADVVYLSDAARIRCPAAAAVIDRVLADDHLTAGENLEARAAIAAGASAFRHAEEVAASLQRGGAAATLPGRCAI
ncbi:hypothetical protein [Sphingosinicella sp. BN140058]|uniref:hypothetical protein n=1 Tax=Sphingosinicella sp. BN140058 TaxID=1892855 RepID=UPI00101273E5|nr:hypothetical protein [Sphingosinicella sp. BN140058]QAY80417.1 hypothetical protein ETR14_27645 [Sphingosinicella sp. BN140058]